MNQQSSVSNLAVADNSIEAPGALTEISNPILKGFNPDPSICRVGDDYYIATSTFEWFPGVQIHHSKDLKNWQLITRPLNRPEMLDMIGNPDSCGIWAPCLTHHDGLFYLCFTNVRRFDGHYKDTPNYLTTCETIDGEWSDPIYINSSGFDPSIYHAEDGRKYWANMIWDHRSQAQFFGGIVLQEYCPEKKKLIGESKIIYRGSELGLTEGPHIYKRNGYYYLLTAEGGTSYNHAVTMARSKDIWGPYETDPMSHIVTAKDHPSSRLQKAGHGDFVETPEGEVFLVHLVGRPLPGTDRCPLGRESAIQRVYWTDDGWLRKHNDNLLPDDVTTSRLGSEVPERTTTHHYSFDQAELPIDFQWLRTPYPETIFSLGDRQGFLRLYGRESIGSWFTQSLVARRQQAFNCTAETKVEFSPSNFQHAAGLVAYYNTEKFHYLHVTYNEEIGPCLSLMSCNASRDWNLEYPVDNLPLSAEDCANGVSLKLEIKGPKLSFYYSLNGTDWHLFADQLDASLLSDDCGYGANFTGNFLGMACQDITGMGTHADFEYFEYFELGD